MPYSAKRGRQYSQTQSQEQTPPPFPPNQGQPVVVQLRLVAGTRQALAQAIEELLAKHPGQLSGLTLPDRPGHKGEWLAYGSFLLVLEGSQSTIVRIDTATGEILD